jgi:hypothetical protein
MESSNIGFWRGLAKCPLCIKTRKTGNPTNPDSTVWNQPKPPTTWERGLHPNAVWSMRSIAQAPGNQCIYDSGGFIVLTANTNGAPDLKTEGTQEHYYNDVKPIILADMLDHGGPGSRMSVYNFILRGIWPLGGYQVNDSPGPNTNKYLEVRQPW